VGDFEVSTTRQVGLTGWARGWEEPQKPFRLDTRQGPFAHLQAVG
jgi:hypothetical protein